MLFFSSECIRVLIKYGADPRVTDDGGTTPLHLAKDDQTREILHKKNRHEDEKADKIGKIFLLFNAIVCNSFRNRVFTANREVCATRGADSSWSTSKLIT